MSEAVQIAPDGVIATLPGVGVVSAAGTTVPSDGAQGFSHGCVFTKTNGTTEADGLYVNTGTSSSCTFKAVDLNVTENAYLSGATAGTSAASKVLITDSSGNHAFTGALTTTDGVASGTARKVGGGAFCQVAASTAITGETETDVAFDQTYTVPANTLKPGTRIRVRAQGIHTATTGTEDHTIALKLGSITIASAAAVDPANNDLFYFDAEIVCRTAGATGTLVACGSLAVGASGTGALVGFLKASTTVDTTAANILGVYIDRQGTATDSDSARLDVLTVDVIG